MIDRNFARSLVERFLATLHPHDGFGYVVEDNQTEEFDIGWLFFWTREDIPNRKRRPPITGNCPIFIHRDGGQIYMYPLNEPLDDFLEKLRRDRNSVRRLVVRRT